MLLVDLPFANELISTSRYVYRDYNVHGQHLSGNICLSTAFTSAVVLPVIGKKNKNILVFPLSDETYCGGTHLILYKHRCSNKTIQYCKSLRL